MYSSSSSATHHIFFPPRLAFGKSTWPISAV
jgi:hypothetical protein